jgi:hypothetical protein
LIFSWSSHLRESKPLISETSEKPNFFFKKQP